MFEVLLNKYKANGSFLFQPHEILKDKCNAPTNQSGVYLIYQIDNTKEILLYNGSSGRKINGEVVHRKTGLGGMKDRIVNGYHPKFGRIPRRISFPNEMKKQGITQLKIYWWITRNEDCTDFPTDVEDSLMRIYLNNNNHHPSWHA